MSDINCGSAGPIRLKEWSNKTLREEGRDFAQSISPNLVNYRPFDVWRRLEDNYRATLANHRSILEEVRKGGLISPSAEWLLDNLHVVEENFTHVRRDLRPKFYANLPVTRGSTEVPWVFAVAWQFVALTNSDIRPNALAEFFDGFQQERILTIGEIWATPALLRLVLLENLRRLSDRSRVARQMRSDANRLADRIILETDGPDLSSLLADHAERSMDSAFASQLLYRLREGGGMAEEALAWLTQREITQGMTLDNAVNAEHARQSASNVTTGNIIRSLRVIDDVDWLEWFESVSRVDHVLRERSDYGLLDKPTRNAYRDTIERIARRSSLSEVEIAEKALAVTGSNDPLGVGQMLIGEGTPELEAACGYRPRPGERFLRSYRRLGWLGIFLPGLLFTLVFAAIFAALLPREPFAVILALVLLALLPASEAAMGFIAFAAARLVPPTRLPGYDYTSGVPDGARTLVVIPSLLSNFDTIDDLLGNLELHYLANSRGAVDFALLTDWADSPSETAPEDAERLDYAYNGIEALAHRYGSDGGRRFYLLHRRRLWNPAEGVWMGWERKRGKLRELNQLLRGDADTTFLDSDATGPRPRADTRYVVTLDSDTRLPRNAISALVGKIAHPVNRPVSDPVTGLVVKGHGILQPRITASLTSGTEASQFQHIFSVNRGLDPYVFAVSDLYQDLLDEGSFTGKGIYDVEAFEQAIGNKIPENRVLSHDLLEGSLARAALVSDVQFIEDFPLRYDVDVARQHRWARGDWQLLPLILDRRNGLNGVARLKMVDNLRRSLVPAAWVGASVIGWLTLPFDAALIWQTALLVTMLLVPVISLNAGLVPRLPGVSLPRHLMVLGREARGCALEVTLRLSFIAHGACAMLDAIARTFWRMTFSKRRLLEWRTAQQTQMEGQREPLTYLRNMWGSVAIGAGAIALVAVVNPQNLPISVFIGMLWVAAPLAAWQVSRSLETEDRLHIGAQDVAMLRRVARVTWRYFETFVTPASHFLPPDNFQDSPEPKLAERTSPTNIGVYLLSVLSARDLGWIGFLAAVERIEQTLDTVDLMEKYNGHLFNWYDTRTLAVLEPRYVSAVDSGNLAGHLLTVASALREWKANPSVHFLGTLEGVSDVLGVVNERLEKVPDDRRALRPLRRRLEERVEGFEKSLTVYLSEPQLAPVRAINLAVIAEDIRRLASDLATELPSPQLDELVWWTNALKSTCDAIISDTPSGTDAMQRLSQRLSALAERARGLAFAMDFAFLLDPDKRLLSIGYRPDQGERDGSCYDLLASEARLASLFAIAKGDVPVEHWMRLGRPVTAVGISGVLLSWSGSMFEYLMPPLVMHERVGGILNQSNATAVQLHIRHGQSLGLPWGVSESAFNARDREMNYQYYAFGVPALALKRAVSGDAVVAPYATLLASQIRPRAAVANLRRLEALGATGPYGFYDAVDFTPARLPEGASHAVVRNVMAHHHGMSIVAITNAVLDGIHRARFHDDPVIKAAELLLQEKAPREIVPVSRAPEATGAAAPVELAQAAQTVIQSPATAARAIALLANDRLAVMQTATGAGYERLGPIAITRWRPDPTVDSGGTYIFLRDQASAAWWSATTSPRAAPGESASTVISDHKVDYHKQAFGIESHLEVIVASEANATGRRLTLRNTGAQLRQIEVTSYGEIVLDTDDADLAHPAFSKMFVRTEISPDSCRITARRNRRSGDQPQLHLAHLIAGPSEGRATQAETDRRAFIGRGRSLGIAAAFDPRARLSGADGFTLDPIFALRRTLRVPAGKTVSLTFWTVIADSEDALALASRHYGRTETFDHESRLAWTHSQVQLRHFNTTLEEAALFRRFAAFLTYPDTSFATRDSDVQASLRQQSALWPMGISGDHPIFLIRIDNEADLPIIHNALMMQEYFISRGVVSDLVILNERASSYIQDLQDAIRSMCDAAARMRPQDPGRASVFTVRRDQMGSEQWETLLAAARIAIHARNGKLSDQIARLDPADDTDGSSESRLLALPPPRRAHRSALREFPQETLEYWNGYGGFSPTTREYVVRLRHGEHTPHPWINVIARDGFGFHTSAGGASFTWAVNSRDHQLTPWSNDPVCNVPGEGIYIRDTATGRTISPFAALSQDPDALHEARHGMGATTFRCWADWIEIEAVQTLAADGPAKLTRLTMTNTGKAALDLGVAAYAELVLGNNRARSAPMIRASLHKDLNAVLASNPYAMALLDRCTALGADRPVIAHTVSRQAFLGRGGTPSQPAAMSAVWPSDAPDETRGDPCAAILTSLSLAPGESKSITFALADAHEDQIASVLKSALSPGATERGLEAAKTHWDGFLGAVQVETPDPKLDLMINTWLPYQALACRIEARSAFYQASGAFGFRDQLQDTSALILQDPDLARHQILNAASRQFIQGDVQHWWLPADGAGVRTIISDDVVWLGHLTARYVEMTGDAAILDEMIAYIDGPALDEGQHDAFFKPETTDQVAPLYDHCARALDLAVARTGPHGLPLILGGDWNDGMNRVGEEGQGESVWLAWFLCATIDSFAPIAQARGDNLRSDAWRAHRARLEQAVETSGWDGAWYKRGFYDDGTPLGSAESDECRIDSIAQSWSAISRAAPPERAAEALDSALRELVDTDPDVVRLFKPPFEKTPKEPGYIKGYPPGVRENGGQYTHAATWLVYALALSGRGDDAYRIFNMINPISHATTRQEADLYRVEPYVVAADVYDADKSGRGGWTWYTGSAGWLYRAAVEGLLGITMESGERLRVNPSIPSDWDGFSARVRLNGDMRQIVVRRNESGFEVTIDGVAQEQSSGAPPPIV